MRVSRIVFVYNHVERASNKKAEGYIPVIEGKEVPSENRAGKGKKR